jgi:hypothetical protein
LRSEARRDRTPGASSIVDDNRLTKLVRHLLRDYARHDIYGADRRATR